MGPTEWRLAATAMVMLALAVTGLTMVRSIWHGRPVAVRRYRAVLVVEIAAGVLLALPGQPPEESLVASIVQASYATPCPPITIERAQPHGERVRLVGTGQATSCGIWAVIEDPRTGSRWLQGPASAHASGWELDLVIGTGVTADEPIRYEIGIAILEPEHHDSWQAIAGEGAIIRLDRSPLAQHWTMASQTATRHGNAVAITPQPR